VLPGLDVELRVWSGRVDFVVPVWADDRIAGIVSEIAHDAVPIRVRVDYQACDDRSCRIPRSETLEVIVPVAPYVGHDLPGKLPGTVPTTMDVRKFMLRKVRRGLLRSPIKGFRYLKQTLQQVRHGPAGRRNRSGPPNATNVTDTKPS
jgi:hypothetical protein